MNLVWLRETFDGTRGTPELLFLGFRRFKTGGRFDGMALTFVLSVQMLEDLVRNGAFAPGSGTGRPVRATGGTVFEGGGE